MKPAVDVTGNLTITKIANAVTAINTFIAKYVGDLRWGYFIVRRGCGTSRWAPSTWGFDDIRGSLKGFVG